MHVQTCVDAKVIVVLVIILEKNFMQYQLVATNPTWAVL